MSNKHDIAQLQDVFYSIGGGSTSISQEQIDQYLELFPPVTVEVVDARWTVDDSTPLVVPMGSITLPFVPMPLPLPWYRRLWIFLNMDIGDVWRMWRG